MNYYTSTQVTGPFETVVSNAREALAAEGFGVITEIDVRDTIQKKLDKTFRNYIILGACNPGLAHQALLAEDKIGVMLPCNVIVQELDSGEVEVAAMDPVAAMEAIGNEQLAAIAGKVQERLKRVVAALS